MDCSKCGQANKEETKFCSNCGTLLTNDVVAPPLAGPKRESSPRLGRKSIGAGLGTALVASLCCVIPLIALTLGIGGVGTVLILGKFRSYFIGASLVFLVIAIGLLLRRNERDECCTLEEKKRNRFLLPLYLLGTYLVVFGLVTYFVTPRLYGQLDSKTVNSSTTKTNSTNVDPANQKEVNIFIQGFTCPSCATGMKSILSRNEGVVEANIGLTGKAKVIYDETKTSPKEILKAIKKFGYKPQILNSE